MTTILFQGVSYSLNKLTVHAKLSTFSIHAEQLPEYKVTEATSPIQGEVLIAVPKGKTALTMMVGKASECVGNKLIYVLTPYQLKQCRA